MILYAAENGKFIEYTDAVAKLPQKKHNLYVNITNQCNCACTFCLRSLKKMPENHSLWLKKEPTISEIEAAFTHIDKNTVNEVVFCGFGEPTMRLETLISALQYVRKIWPEHNIRLNTNGLSSLYYNKDTAILFKDLLDTISISLNASNAQKYLAVTRTSLGLSAHKAMLKFAQECQKYIPHVILTIVDSIGREEITACQNLCQKYNLFLRIRPYEAN
ncbi:TatD family nuclease-associated radical SAM protein [Pectinatus sottacetonis]|uniref:TatD family nuclease-associated radical SAM protein n=1 Tax=Pectinatus sottacetonis TaxID=1002795 RepID=UPI0018C76A2C|nr:TatD family nuclease-associated radical SAM protein [Pectinatus sottacetonis]